MYSHKSPTWGLILALKNNICLINRVVDHRSESYVIS
nr:MAG TPA: hypothetical protein [Caudoviricetes sp.]